MDAFEHHRLKEEGEAELSFGRPGLLGSPHVDADHDLGSFHKIDDTTTIPLLFVPTRFSSSRRRRREEVGVAGENVVKNFHITLRTQASRHEPLG
jgi:hypothetical protein